VDIILEEKEKLQARARSPQRASRLRERPPACT